MSTIVSFDEVWYHEFIERFSPETGDDHTDATCRTMLVSACVISQGLDGLAKAVNNLAKAVESHSQ